MTELCQLLARHLAFVPGNRGAAELDGAFVALAADDDAVAGLGAGKGGGDGLAPVLDLNEVTTANAAGLLGVAQDERDDGDEPGRLPRLLLRPA